MVEIVERLYLGNRDSARNRAALLAAGVTHVVNCTEELPCYFDGELVYKSLHLHDPDPTFHTRLEDVCAFLDVARRHGKALVHCFAAISRSPATVLAYLCHLGEGLEEAALRMGRRAWTDPDPIFLRQIAEHFGLERTEQELEHVAGLLRGAVG
jgi:protein-tyrosine phosphatase